MTDGTADLNLAEVLRPLTERHAELVARRDQLAQELRVAKDAVLDVERILKAAGVMPRATYGAGSVKAQPGPKRPGTITDAGPKQAPSPGLTQRTLALVGTVQEIDAPTAANALGVSKSSAGKTLSWLRAQGQIRLIRMAPSHADGRGQKPIYGPWPAGGNDHAQS